MRTDENTPVWMTDYAYKTLKRQYMLPGEEPIDMYKRVSRAGSTNDALYERILSYFWKGWLGASSPILSNLGTTRGLPIACYGINSAEDSVAGIYEKVKEQALLSQYGGGVGIGLNNIRGNGAPIKGNGVSHGVVPWCTVHDATTVAVNQGGTRKGAASVGISIDHTDIEDFIRMRSSDGEDNLRVRNTQLCVHIPDSFMERLDTDEDARALFIKLLKQRVEKGGPYIMFTDSVNAANPEGYKQRGLEVQHTNICTEITLFSDFTHTFVCCLASVNLARYDEWKDDANFVGDCVEFLDNVMESFIVEARKRPGMENAIRFSEKSRPLGLGVMGYHTLLQQRMLPFGSREAYRLNTAIFKDLHAQATKKSRELGQERGIPEWCTDQRNSHVLAIAPTFSNSLLTGQVSAGIEPVYMNSFAQKTASGVIYRKNLALVPHLEAAGLNTEEVWGQIANAQGSVQDLDLPEDVKEVFRTAFEINQLDVVRQAANRQYFICQAQSLNLFFPNTVKGAWLVKVHREAWESGVKTLYYLRSEQLHGAGASIAVDVDTCSACEG